jgi:hypothetical protein
VGERDKLAHAASARFVSKRWHTIKRKKGIGRLPGTALISAPFV